MLTSEAGPLPPFSERERERREGTCFDGVWLFLCSTNTFPVLFSAFDNPLYLIQSVLSAEFSFQKDTAFLMEVSLNIDLIKMKYCSGTEHKC